MTSSRREISRRTFLEWAALIGGGALGVGLAGCGTSSPASSPSPSASAPASASPSASASASPSASAPASASPSAASFPATNAATSHLKEVTQEAATIIADALGYFKEVGLNQKLTDFSAGGSDPIRPMLTGNVSYGIALSTASAITAFQQGQPIRIIAGAQNDASIVFLVKADSPIKTIQDLKGKKIGYTSPGSVTDFATSTSLKKAGIFDQVQRVAVGSPSAIWSALKAGTIDCGAGVDPVATQLIKSGENRLLFKAAQYIPDNINTCTICSADYLQKNLPLLKAMLSALNKANQLIINDPATAAQAWSKVIGIPEDICLISLKNIPPRGWTLQLVPAGLTSMEQGLLDMGLIKQKVDWTKLLDQSALPKELQEPLPTS